MVSAPIDRLSLRLQHLDGTTGGGLLELCDTTSSGLLDRCLRTLWELLNDWSESDCQWLLPFLDWFIHDLGIPHDDLMDSHYSSCVGLGAAIWARMIVIYHFYPFRLSLQQRTAFGLAFRWTVVGRPV